MPEETWMRRAILRLGTVFLAMAGVRTRSQASGGESGQPATPPTTHTPLLFRVILQVSGLDEAARFYTSLLGIEGRRIRGARLYFDCGPVILALLDPTAGGMKSQPNPDYIYFSVGDLEAIHLRARTLGCLSRENVDGGPAGEIVVRPWGERSFYARDPFGNGLCFVDARTLFTGR
jgi:catechol 2,3-dioxygenase-like lactoylglutathione lyase family enzyme